MDRYLIIADDFTGANDTGVQLRRRGLPTSVIFAGRPLPKGEGCVVIDTESRGSSPEGAGAAVSASCAQVNFADYKYVIKKVDSPSAATSPPRSRPSTASTSPSSSSSCPRCPPWAARP